MKENKKNIGPLEKEMTRVIPIIMNPFLTVELRWTTILVSTCIVPISPHVI